MGCLSKRLTAALSSCEVRERDHTTSTRSRTVEVAGNIFNMQYILRTIPTRLCFVSLMSSLCQMFVFYVQLLSTKIPERRLLRLRTSDFDVCSLTCDPPFSDAIRLLRRFLRML